MTPLESKQALTLLADDAVDTIEWTLHRTSGSFENRRLQLLDVGQSLIGYYSEGSAALAVDLYDESRADAQAKGRFSTAPVIADRTVKVRRSIAWASAPLATGDDDAAFGRLAEVMRSEVVRPYRDTILTARKKDPQSAGWTRIASGGACGFCKALAARGAVYREATARFAAHDSCSCTAAPVFIGGAMGPEASAMQYKASRRSRSPRERALIREWASAYGDV